MPYNQHRRRVVLHGLPYFSGKLLKILQDECWEVRFHAQHSMWGLFRLITDLARCDLAFTWGGRISMGKFLWAARCLRKKNVVLLWCGSDVQYAKKEVEAGKRSPWIAGKIHWAVSQILAEEVQALGPGCEYVQVSFVDPVKDVVPLPEKFSVLTYVPGLKKGTLYGLAQIQEVAEAMPDVDFNVVGWPEEDHLKGPSNLKLHGRIQDLAAFFQRASVVWRPVQHDAGISFMVLEALAQGRHVIYSYPFPACIQASSAETARQELERLRSLHTSGDLRMNEAGIRIVSGEFSPEKVRATLFCKWEEIIRLSAANPAGVLEEDEIDNSSPAARMK